MPVPTRANVHTAGRPSRLPNTLNDVAPTASAPDGSGAANTPWATAASLETSIVTTSPATTPGFCAPPAPGVAGGTVAPGGSVVVTAQLAFGEHSRAINGASPLAEYTRRVTPSRVVRQNKRCSDAGADCSVGLPGIDGTSAPADGGASGVGCCPATSFAPLLERPTRPAAKPAAGPATNATASAATRSRRLAATPCAARVVIST